eukprot:978189-Pelagomonas_calceolata.AAC.1
MYPCLGMHNVSRFRLRACTFYYYQASSEDVSHFLQKQTNETYRFVSDLIDIFCAVGTVEQAEQPNYLADWFGYRHVLLQLSCPRRQ